MTHDEILRAVQALPQMKDKTLIHLSIVGSRSKQLASRDSDYDLKAVVLHSTKSYLLQKATPSKSFSTSIVDSHTGNLVEVEGTLADYLQMQDHALKSHQAAYDALFGIPIYETPEGQYLKRLFCRAYDPRPLVHSYSGLLRAERKRAERKNRLGGIKHVANMVYYASAVHAFQTNSGPPSHDAFFLLEELRSIDPELRGRMRSLYEQRKLDKSRTDVDLSPFADFIEIALESKSLESMRTTEEFQALKEETENHFLKLCLK